MGNLTVLQISKITFGCLPAVNWGLQNARHLLKKASWIGNKNNDNNDDDDDDDDDDDN